MHIWNVVRVLHNLMATGIEFHRFAAAEKTLVSMGY